LRFELEIVHRFLRWHYPDQVLRVGGALRPPSQPGCPELPGTTVRIVAKAPARLAGFAAGDPGYAGPVTNVLLVTTVAADEATLGDELRRAVGRDDANVVIVAPATSLSTLDWLANDEDAARLEASRAADAAAEALDADEVSIDRGSHDSNVAEAVADALRNFHPDEIVVVTRPGERSNWLEDEAVKTAFESSTAPVRHVELDPAD
jgi:GABA permease